MDDAPVSYFLDSNPRQLSFRLALWWLAAFALTGAIVWNFISRGRAGILTFQTGVELLTLVAFWLYGIVTQKLIITKGQAWRLDLHPDHLLLLHYYNKEPWCAYYRDITEVSLHFASASCSYDRMELALATVDGDMGFTGACHCRGEKMESLAAEIRHRVENASGRTPGSAAEDRLTREDMATAERRRIWLLILLSLPIVLAIPALVEYYARQENELRKNGVVTAGIVTSTSPGHGETLISYEYGEEWGQRLHGNGVIPVDSANLGEIKTGSTVPILYDPETREISTLLASPPQQFTIFRIIAFLPLALFIIASYFAFTGKSIVYARGMLYLLRKGELVEDRIKRRETQEEL